MTIPTKAEILRRHQENALINAESPSIMMRDSRDLGADELFAPIDERMIASAVEALESGQTHYVDVPGIGPLRDSIAAYLNATFGTNYQKPNILVTAGSQEGRFLTIQMIGERFERIAVPEVVHPGVRKALGVRPIRADFFPIDSATMLPTVTGIKATLEAGARLIFLESPSRLTGAAYSAEQVAEIAALIKAHDASVIWDQGLSPWVASGYASIASQPDMAERTALIGEVYPGMGMSSWFIGAIAAPAAWVTSMQSQKQIMAICTSTPTQYAALEAGKLFGDAHTGHLQLLSQARSAFTQRATKAGLKVIAGQTETVLSVRTGDAAKLRDKLEKAGYHIADGGPFGAPDVVRITVSLTSAAEDAFKLLE